MGASCGAAAARGACLHAACLVYLSPSAHTLGTPAFSSPTHCPEPLTEPNLVNLAATWSPTFTRTQRCWRCRGTWERARRLGCWSRRVGGGRLLGGRARAGNGPRAGGRSCGAALRRRVVLRPCCCWRRRARHMTRCGRTACSPTRASSRVCQCPGCPAGRLPHWFGEGGRAQRVVRQAGSRQSACHATLPSRSGEHRAPRAPPRPQSTCASAGGRAAWRRRRRPGPTWRLQAWSPTSFCTQP